MNPELELFIGHAEHTAMGQVDGWFNDTIRALQHCAEEMEKYRCRIKSAMEARKRIPRDEQISAPPPESAEVLMSWAVNDLKDVYGNIRFDTAMTIGGYLAITSFLRRKDVGL
jgi:hypothetical protein